MAMLTGRFEQAARSVARRTAELLAVPVSVVDHQGSVVARGEPAGAVPNEQTSHPVQREQPLRVPVRLDGQACEVVIDAIPGDALPDRLAGALVELAVNQASVIDRLPDQHEMKNKFIHDLLRGEAGDEAGALREAQILGMDVSRPRAVILIDAADYILGTGGDTLTGGRAASVRRSVLRARGVVNAVVRFFRLPDETICAYIGDGEVAVLKASATQDLNAWADDGIRAQGGASWSNLAALKRASEELLDCLRHDLGEPVSIGIGRYHPGIPGIARSYEDARAALSLGRRFHGENRVNCLDSVGIAAFVGISDERTKIELARHLLSPLDQDGELLTTLNAFFAENCSPSGTAARLTIHRNTLAYRLDKIASLTGLDARRFDDAVQIRLALALRSLTGAAGVRAVAQ